jgi:hypothetical protein
MFSSVVLVVLIVLYSVLKFFNEFTGIIGAGTGDLGRRGGTFDGVDGPHQRQCRYAASRAVFDGNDRRPRGTAGALSTYPA